MRILITGHKGFVGGYFMRKYKDHDIVGIDIKSNIRADENLRWWYGDNDIQYKAAMQGEFIYVPCEVEHIHPNELTSSNPDLIELTKADQRYFEEKWGILL